MPMGGLPPRAPPPALPPPRTPPSALPPLRRAAVLLFDLRLRRPGGPDLRRSPPPGGSATHAPRGTPREDPQLRRTSAGRASSRRLRGPPPPQLAGWPICPHPLQLVGSTPPPPLPYSLAALCSPAKLCRWRQFRGQGRQQPGVWFLSVRTSVTFWFVIDASLESLQCCNAEFADGMNSLHCAAGGSMFDQHMQKFQLKNEVQLGVFFEFSSLQF